MQKSKKINFLLIILLVSMLIVIPNLLISIQRDSEIPIDKRNSNEIINTRPPQESYVYYENTTGEAVGVCVSGDYAYVADGLSGLAVIDISDPTNPGTPIYEDTTGDACSVYVSGNYAYMADGPSGLAVIDVSDPTNPGTPVYEATTGTTKGVYVSGDYAYVADGLSGLAIIDISNPTNPGTPDYEPTTGNANGVYVSGDYAYVADGPSGLAVMNISDPTNPGTPVYEWTTGYAEGVYLSGDYAYVADGYSGLAVIDISVSIDPGTPIYRNTGGHACGVYVNGDYAYVADHTSGLAVIDISDPTNPGTPIHENTDGCAVNIYVSGDYAYVADFGSGLAVIDISDPTNPGTPIYEDTTGYASEVYVSGDYAYVADYTSGLAVIDISDPTNPVTVNYANTDGSAMGVYVSGDYAYVADYTYGLAVIDISDPTNPVTVNYADTFGTTREVYVSGDYAYVTDYTEGLAVIDISDPTNPRLSAYEDTDGYVGGVYVSGDRAYMTDGYFGLAVIDISDPTNPGAPVYGNTTGGACDVYVSGDYAYVADGTSGLAVIQVRKRVDMEDPIISNAPSDFTVEAGYTGHSLSWTAIDANPDTYTIELQGTGIVAGPTAWTSENAINYNIPNGLSVGSCIYTVNFTDDYGNFITDSVTFTIEDTTNPVITVSPINFTVEEGYTGQSLSWTATDASPDTYTIELQGTGIVAGSTLWTSGNAINYNIPNGFSVGSYIYMVTFTDLGGNFITDNVNFTVIEDTTNPIITASPNNFTVEEGYTGQSLSWTATDLNPNTYAIELQGSEIVVGPTLWVSGNAINYNIPNGFSVGSYIYTVNFIDDYGNFITDSVNFTVEDTTNPVITVGPNNFTVEYGYTGQSLSWTATDLNPNTYAIELQGSEIVVGPTLWVSGNAINYNIPNGFSVGSYVYTINFTDESGNSIIDSVNFIVEEPIDPTIISAPSDLTVEFEYTGQSISWTATDPNPHTYTIELHGSGIVAGPTAWTSGVKITYNVPDSLAVGVYVYTVNFTDDCGNSIVDSVTFTVCDTTNPSIISAPSDLTVEFGYTGQSISWTATDANPHTYTIELQGSGIVAGPTAWTSGITIKYNIPDSFAPGVYTYNITFTDESGNSISNTVTVTINSIDDDDETPGGAIPFGNSFLIFVGFSVICLIFTKKRQIVRESRY